MRLDLPTMTTDPLNSALDWAQNRDPRSRGKGYAALAKHLTAAGFPIQQAAVMRWDQRGRVPPWWHRPIEIATMGQVTAAHFNLKTRELHACPSV